ncbi:alanine racemase [soil metagenome]
MLNPEPLSEIETPAMIVDRDRLQQNIAQMQSLADGRGVRLRPHIKTHKCVEIAQLQLAQGALGVTASKVEEALVFIAAGVRSVTVAYPIVDRRKLARLLRGAQAHGTELRVVVDSAAGFEALTRGSQDAGTVVGAFVEVDVGLRRCGLTEHDPQLGPLARAVHENPTTKFMGLLSHAGHAYAASNREEVAAIAAEECQILQRVRQHLEKAGIPVPEVSVGSTPTVLASDSYDGITEIRPGNYVFLDRTPVRLGLATMAQVALSVVSTVVSRNDDFLIIDAGSKVLSSDLGAHGTAGVDGYGLAFSESGEQLQVVRLSEEHGFVARGGADLPIGTRLRIVPNHSCPVVNLADELVVVSDGEVVGRWRVAARGAL